MCNWGLLKFFGRNGFNTHMLLAIGPVKPVFAQSLQCVPPAMPIFVAKYHCTDND